MSDDPTFPVAPIGYVRSSLHDPVRAPKQGTEGAPSAWLEIDARYRDGLSSIEVGDALIVVTWLHLADRSTLEVHPRDDRSNPLTGVFSTRSADRPNPIGVHPVVVRERRADELLVEPLEAVDGTPVIDLKAAI